MGASNLVTVGNELNHLVDALGLRLRRNVTVDDHRLRQLAFSSHEFGVVDEMRLQSILTRDVPKGAAEWIRGSGAPSADGPFRPRLPEQTSRDGDGDQQRGGDRENDVERERGSETRRVVLSEGRERAAHRRQQARSVRHRHTIRLDR